MRYLPPLPFRERYYVGVEREINRIMRELIYVPLFRIASGYTWDVRNAPDALAEAVAQGLVWYEGGEFHGKFSAEVSRQISRLGGIFNRKTRTWALKQDKVPIEVKFAQTDANSRYESMRAEILSTLSDVDPELVSRISKATEEYGRTITEMDDDFKRGIAKSNLYELAGKARDEFTIEANLTEAQRAIIARDWGQNLDLYIKGWVKEDILKLREEIQPHVMAGGRAKGLIENLTKNYGVSQRKAKFLARQETSLLMSKFRETRYTGMGVTRYKWSTSHDEKVRLDHRALNGKFFSFDDPPITNRKKKARNNPGEDFNCRCIAIGIVE